MQTIESSVLRAVVDEKGAQLVNFVSQSNHVDYFKNSDAQKKLEVAFTGPDQTENWATLLPWTVVDKGDSRVSLALIDDNTSYKKFPYHFEAILTYSLEGNRIDIKCYLKNNSHKEMPFSLTFTLPILTGWTGIEKMDGIELKSAAATIQLSSTNFALTVKNDQLQATVAQATLNSDSDEELALTMTFS